MSLRSVPCQDPLLKHRLTLMFATTRYISAACFRSATRRPGRAQKKSLEKSGHEGQADRCVFQASRLPQVEGWLPAAVFLFLAFLFALSLCSPVAANTKQRVPKKIV